MCRGLLLVCILWIGAFLDASAQKEKTKTKNAKERIEKSQYKIDSLRAKIQEATGVEATTPSLAPSISLPGGKTATISSLLGETIPDLGLKAAEFKERRKERRRKAKKAKLAKVQYEGIPMETVITRFGSGDRAVIEEFHVLKENQPINSYVWSTNIRWYDMKSKKLSSSVIKDKAKALPLHGRYRKYVAGNLMEEGYYYMGTKDGRWTRYNAKYILLDKSHWYHGFPAESKITYYDSAYTKIKEVIPAQYGLTQGDYLSFYEEGQLKMKGKYERDKRVGRWVEYYQFGGRKQKTEYQYPKTCWDEQFEPFVTRQWDEKGKVTVNSTSDPRVSASETEEEN